MVDNSSFIASGGFDCCGKTDSLLDFQEKIDHSDAGSFALSLTLE